MIQKETKVKGMKDWKGNFNDAFKVGDKVTGEIVEYFRNVLPPLTDTGDLVQCSEPCSHEVDCDTGYLKATYTTFANENGEWIYKGECFSGKVKEPEVEVKKLKLSGIDGWDRALYKDEEGKTYVDVDMGLGHQEEPCLHTMTSMGKPIEPVKFKFEIIQEQYLENEEELSL